MHGPARVIIHGLSGVVVIRFVEVDHAVQNARTRSPRSSRPLVFRWPAFGAETRRCRGGWVFLTIFCHNVFVYCVDPNSGQFTTLFPPNCGYDKGAGITAFPGNDGVCCFPRCPTPPDSSSFTITAPRACRWWAPWTPRLSCCRIFAWTRTAIWWSWPGETRPRFSGLYRLAVDGSVKATLATGLTGAVAMEEDLVSGDFVVAMPGGDILRVTRHGGAVSTVATRVLPGATPGLGANLRMELGTGQMLVTWNQSVFRLDPLTGILTTLLQDATSHIGLAHDPVHGHYYRTDQNALVRYDPATGVTLQVMAFPSVSIPGDVATWGSRMLDGHGCPHAVARRIPSP